jgi:hypothetical protein
MKTPILRRRALILSAGGAIATPMIASGIARAADDWPTKPVRYINVFPPGGPTDTLSRIVCHQLSEVTGQQFIVEKMLFKREQRALSHGCVRVEQARALAAWALGVSEEEIDSMSSRGTYSVPLTENIPVSLVYLTRFPDESGQLVSYPDIYASR